MKPIKTTPKIQDKISVMLIPVEKPEKIKGSKDAKKSS